MQMVPMERGLPLGQQSSEREDADGAECAAAERTERRPRSARGAVTPPITAVPIEIHQTFLHTHTHSTASLYHYQHQLIISR